MMATTTDDDREHGFKEAVWQFLNAYMRGTTPDIEELVREYPEFEDQIRQKITEFREVDSLFDFLSRADESDFEGTLTSEDLVGRKIGSFEITEMIGRGGMGVVYLAHDTKLKRSVAIKSVPAKLAADSTARMRFRREAELLAALNHPNIAVIHDIIEEEKSGYLILEYVPGQTLAELIAREPLKLEEALTIGRQIAEAVSAAHEKGVVHRDLKPSNIKITPDGRVKVLDFGLAKASLSKAKSGEITETQPGRVVGTPAYMSPEQARGKSMDYRTDIWSFGCIMYEMLTGRLPFEGETATDTLARIIERQPDWDLLPERTPMNVRALLRQCLEKDPDQRLANITNAALEISETLSASALAVPTKSRKVAMIFGAAIIIVVTAIAVRFIPEKQAQLSPKDIRLVVLPFENLGSAEDEYFAAGITDAIIARLGSIHGLGVISRQSAMQYKNKEKSAKVIGEELGVDYILEGTVQRERQSDPNRPVRIIPQLIRISDDTHVWSDIYDDDMSEIFRVQSDLAERVAQALDITLLEPERRTLRIRLTENMEAYDYYLRGNEYFHRSVLENDFRIAMRMYEQAVELEPTFALAHAQLSRTHMMMYWDYHDRSEECLEMAKQAVDKAFQLDPDLPEVRLALGHYYYHGHLDYDRALEQFAIAQKSQPNSSEVLSWISFIHRRQGKFEQALANIKQAYELDPMSSFLAGEVGQTYRLLRKYSEAEHYYERSISLRPDVPVAYDFKARLYLVWQGSTEKARTVVKQASENIKSAENLFVGILATLDVYDGNYQDALDRLTLKSEDIDNQFNFIPKTLRYAQIYGYMNSKELEQRYYESARSILQAKIEEKPEDARFHSSMGITYAGLGRKEDAISEGKLGVELLPVSKEAVRGLSKVDDLARIYVMVGEYDAAIDQIEFLLANPGPMSIPLLRLAPVWEPLRDHPRFKKLVELKR